MSQTTITSFYSSRKRPAADDIVGSKSKIAHIERNAETGIHSDRKFIIKPRDFLVKDCKTGTVSNEIPVNGLKNVNNLNGLIALPPKNVHEPKDSSAFAKKQNYTNVIKNNNFAKSEQVSSARKELSLGDIRKKLAGSSRLAELRATAERVSKGIKDLKEATSKKNLKEFKSIDVEILSSPSKQRALAQRELLSPKKEFINTEQHPLISPRKVIVSPVKSPSKVPAYIRHGSLATTSTSLPLPHQYRFLAELFRGMETVVALLYNRNEKITFKKLKPSIQEMLKRSFSEKHLAQIKHLVPDFYNFEVKKIKGFSTSQNESYELLISPNIPTDIKIMNPSVLLERRRYFYDTLLQLTKRHHAQYLLTLDPPMVISDEKLTRWHPEFEIEKLPEVECAKIPEMPHVEKLSSAQDVLSKARELFKCNTKMERALEKLVQAKARGLTDQEKVVTGLKDDKVGINSTATQTGQKLHQHSASAVNIINPALRNLPTALLEKVKAKQAAKALEAMTRSTQNDEKYLVYSRLPDLARTLRNIFVTERKNVLALNIILSKLESSFKSNVSANDLQRDIKVLTEEAPDWLKLHNIRNATYLKLDKNVNLKIITDKLEALAEKYKID